MSGFRSARRRAAFVAFTFWLLLDESAAALQPSQLIAPVQQELLIRSYRRCVNIGPKGSRSKEEAAPLAGAYPFDVDALSLLKNADIERAPREHVQGRIYLRCDWFGFRHRQAGD